MERRLLFSRETIQKRVGELAQQIGKDYAGKEPLLIGILNGVVFFFADLVRAIEIPTKMDFIRASSYGSGMRSSGEIRITKDVELPVQGRPVILVEDIVDTGLTLGKLIDQLTQRGVESLRVCALIDKMERRESPICIDYCGFRIEKGFVVGYGLDYDEQYRYYPEIYVLE